jgi:hypothetical protein
MPIFDDTEMKSHLPGLLGANFGFSGTRIENLGAAEYTLVVIAADMSGSVHHFKREIESCISEIVRACASSPHSDNLMLRLIGFDSEIEELHGYKPLPECKASAYQGCLNAGGATALYDASVNAVESITRYGRELSAHGLDVNGIVFVITDGCDNSSTLNMAAVRKALEGAVGAEVVESMVSILVGVDVSSSSTSTALMEYSARAGFTRYLELDRADAATLARLADFATRSIAAQSIALGSLSPSVSLSF